MANKKALTKYSDGMKIVPTYEELIDYIERDPDKIKYPDRSAKFIRNSFELSVLDHFGQAAIEEQQENEMKEHIKEYELQQLANKNQSSILAERALHDISHPPQITQPTPQPLPSSSSHHQSPHGASSSNMLGSIIGGLRNLAGNVFSGGGAQPQPIEEEDDDEQQQSQIPPWLLPPDQQFQSMEEFYSNKIKSSEEDDERQQEKISSVRSQLSQHLSEVGAQPHV